MDLTDKSFDKAIFPIKTLNNPIISTRLKPLRKTDNIKSPNMFTYLRGEDRYIDFLEITSNQHLRNRLSSSTLKLPANIRIEQHRFSIFAGNENSTVATCRLKKT